MTDRKALADSNDTPEDVATLYSWANLHGAKYRDFSASRAQTREKARLRVQEAMEQERIRSREEAEAQKAVEAQRVAETLRAEEARRQADSAAAHAAAQQATHHAAQQAAQQTAQSGWQTPPPERYAAAPGMPPAAAPVAPYYAAPSYAAPAYQQPQPQQEYSNFAPPQPFYPAASQPPAAPPAREDSFLATRGQWAQAEPRENLSRPAWLASERSEMPPMPTPQQAPEDTLQGSRDRLASRWFALKSVFDGNAAPIDAAPAPQPMASRAPIMAVFSLAGGVGKTSLVATLGRALSARGERVLLVDTAAYGLLPFFFGARDQRPGLLRTFSPPGASGDAPIQMVTIDPESLGPENAVQETLTTEITRHGRGVSRVIIDLATASGATTRRIMRLAPTVLVPIVPDMSSVVSVSSIDSFFQHNSAAAGKPIQPYYVLNQFDASLPLHLDVREVLREQVGERLLPFALRRAPAVSEALAEGMTVMDYAPNSTVAEDFGSLAGWVKSLAAPATTSYRGVRWSER